MTSTPKINPDIVVRFAPSPNGLLHLGHAYAAIVAHDYARQAAGRFLLRIEDIDTQRSKPEFVEAILADLQWLGLDWDGDVIFQSDRFDDYAAAAEKLKKSGLLYPCFCTRSEMRGAQIEAGLQEGPDGPVYPGTCKHLDQGEVSRRMASEPYCWRLDVTKAISVTGALRWDDEKKGEQVAAPETLGDVVILPKETPVAYHLAVTLDDARDGITHVVRGKDLFASTHIHRLLQALFDLPVPKYLHHRILLDETGQKLAKSRDSASLTVLRNSGVNGKELADKLRTGQLPLGIMLSKD